MTRSEWSRSSSSSDRSPDDVPHYDMNGTPRIGVPIAEGISRTVAWYEEHGVGETYTHLKG